VSYIKKLLLLKATAYAIFSKILTKCHFLLKFPQVAYAYNPTYSWGRDQEDGGSEQANLGKQDLTLNN
jgi:hypothetical protein